MNAATAMSIEQIVEKVWLSIAERRLRPASSSRKNSLPLFSVSVAPAFAGVDGA